MRRIFLGAAALTFALGLSAARAQDMPVFKVGVLNDQSGVYSDVTGLGSVEAAKMAVENDVHVVGISTLAAGHKVLVPELVKALKQEGGGDILVVVGGIIPPKDYDPLRTAGAACVFGPGTPVTDSANQVLNALEKR